MAVLPSFIRASRVAWAVSLARLAMRPDARMAAAVIGLAAALSLPLVATLVLAGLEPTVDPRNGWIAVSRHPDGFDLARLASPPRALIATATVEGQPYAAYVLAPPGAPRVLAGHALVPPGLAVAPTLHGLRLTVDGAAAPDPSGPAPLPRVPAPLVAPYTILVNRSDLPDAPITVAHFAALPRLGGQTAVVAPARGADAFEAATTSGLKGAGWGLLAVTLPAVGLVAGTFARLEARERSHDAAVLAALGGPRLGALLLAARTVWVVAWAALLAAAVAALAWRFGGATFHPSPFPLGALILAGALPAALAVAVGLATLRGFGRTVQATLRRGPREPAARPLRLPFELRPLVLGTAALPILAVAAALFVADVGFPLAAAAIPAQVAGGEGEWVAGAEGGLQVGAGVPSGPAGVATLDPAVHAVLAEAVAPTLIDGHPVVVRGASWAAIASYHGVRIVAGRPPVGMAVVLGERLADRHGLQPGDHVSVLGAAQPFAARLEVVGIAQAPGVLGDEAFVTMEVGQALAGLAPGFASFLRVRPGTPEARDAVIRPGPEVQVTGLRLDPVAPQAGQMASVLVDAVNLGGQQGTRQLTLRVNGLGAGQGTLVVAPHGRATLRLPFLVPEGPLTIEVNPTLGAAAGAARARLETPSLWFRDDALAVRALAANGTPLAGVRIGLFASLETAAARGTPVAQATTNGTGHASFAGPARNGILATLTGPPAASAVHRGSLRAAANLTVEAVWTQPALPEPGVASQVFVTVRNTGGVAGSRSLPVRVDGSVIQVHSVALGAGNVSSFAIPVIFPGPPGLLQVGEAALRIGTATPSTGPPPRDPLGVPVRRGESLQAAAADRLLGDARTALVALAVVSLASSLAVVWMGTQRALRSRRHVLGVLEALGRDRAYVRSRAAAEAGAMAAVAMLAVLLPMKALFVLAGGASGPAVFGHAIPDPVGWLFALQATAAFAGACALAAYVVAGRTLRARM